MRSFLNLRLLGPVMVLATGVAALAQGPTYHLGRPPSAEESQVCCLPVTPDGRGLLPGSGSAKQGAPIFAAKCAGCHGPTGAEGPWNPLVAIGQSRGQQPQGGPGYDQGPGEPGERGGVGRFLYATTIWDYINRFMPPLEKRTDWKGGRLLTADEVYALTAFLLYRTGIIGENDVLDAQSLPKVRMPRRASYVTGRPEWKVP